MYARAHYCLESFRTICMMSAECGEKEVLVVFNGRRRPVKFHCPTASPAESYHSLVNAVESAFCDILNAEEGNSKSDSGFYLQVESREWEGFIDVIPETPINNHATIYLCKPYNSAAQGGRSLENEQDRAGSSEKVQCSYVYFLSFVHTTE